MNQKISIRQEVAEILTGLFGNKGEGKVFQSENTTKRSGGGKKYTKYDLRTSVSWSAKLDGDQPIWVYCVGMTMTEFIKEVKINNIYYFVSNEYGFPNITIYRKKPEWKTYGYVKKINVEKRELTLYLADLLLVDEVFTEITNEAPKWLINSPPNLYATFTCKIYQGWRSLESFEEFNWSKIWKTFKLDSYLSYDELLNYF